MRGARAAGPCALALAGVLAATGPAGAAGGVTDVQLLAGARFDDPDYGYQTASGWMGTLTLEHFGLWGYGDHFFFVDAYLGDFVDAEGARTGLRVTPFVLWNPRLSLGKVLGGVLGREVSFGPLRDVFLSARVDLGPGFYALLVGGSAEVQLGALGMAGLNVLLRKPRRAPLTLQLTPYWSLPLTLGRARVLLTGFLDVRGTDGKGVELFAQPQALLDVLALAGGTPDRLHVGVEWYVHVNAVVQDEAPQAMVRWSW